MKISLQQLERELAKKLASLYLVSGDDILLVQEAVQRIRDTARTAGFAERVALSVEAGVDWSRQLHAEIHSLSLFSSKRIIELQLGSTKPNATTGKVLKEIAAAPLTDVILIISTQKLDSKTEQTVWYKALDKVGVTLPIWPITPDQLPQWIIQRAKQSRLTISPEAARRLAMQVEGNLLAAAQEIEKLGLLQLDGTIDANMIEEAVTDNARFDIFNLVECALSGHGARCLRMLANLEAEGTEPVLVLWALAREVRTLTELAQQARQGIPLGNLFSQYRIWEKRQPGVRRFLQQHSPASCFRLLSQASGVDRLTKGADKGSVWDALRQLSLAIAGTAILSVSSPAS